jgi:hypothetical protein
MALRHFSEPIGRAGEVLVVRGLLTDDLRFLPLGGGSEHRRPPLRGCVQTDVELVLLDAADRPLATERGSLSSVAECSPHVARAQVLEGSVPLRAGAKAIAVRRNGIDVARLEVGSRPELKLVWSEGSVKRSGKYTLRIDHSTPAPDAMLKVFYVWGPERYLLAGYGPPRKAVEVRFDGLPGGAECSIVVVYTSGFRSVVARTAPFAVPPLPPEVAIARPRNNQVFAPWHPIELEARVRDRQAPGKTAAACAWSLDGKPAGKGQLVYAGMLEPGTYSAVLAYGEVTRTVKFHVRKPK